jgi:hypothetical protein
MPSCSTPSQKLKCAGNPRGRDTILSGFTRVTFRAVA